jgi:hypothetical protein
MNEQKEHIVTTCADFTPDLSLQSTLNCIVTACKSWVFQYSPETKCQEYGAENKIITDTHKVSLAKIMDQTMFNALSDQQGVIHKEFVHEGKT